MGALADISDLISAINQRSDADDIANKVVSGDPTVADAPGAPVGSGIINAWVPQHGTSPLPAGLASLVANKQASALSQVGQDAISGNVDAPTALQRVNQITGGDPTKLIGMVSQLRAYGLMPQAANGNPQQTASGAPPNPMATRAPALAQYGTQGDGNPNAPVPQTLPSQPGATPYPNLQAVGNSAPPQQSSGLTQPQQIMQAAVLNGQNPLEIQTKLADLAKAQAETRSSNATAQKTENETLPPGTMKGANGEIVRVGPDGQITQTVPENPLARGKLEDVLSQMAGKVDALHKIGGTIEEGGKVWDNKLNQLEATQEPIVHVPLVGDVVPSGQSIMQGNPKQTLRDDIQALTKQAMPLYMQANGITPGMERAQAAQQMLVDALGGSVGKSRQYLLSNIASLSQRAGTGDLAKKIYNQNPNLPVPDVEAKQNDLSNYDNGQGSKTIQSVTQPKQAAPQFQEGQTAINRQTGQRIAFRKGQWVPQ